jgi:hypothetical protein
MPALEARNAGDEQHCYDQKEAGGWPGNADYGFDFDAEAARRGFSGQP